ncbi:MAG: hypothetical protein QXI32_00755 [Candidatus Bathyarchaeia archaeon]
MTRMSGGTRRRSSPILVLYVIALGMLSLSAYYIYQAIGAYLEGMVDRAIFFAIIGITGVGVTMYMMSSMMKRVTKRVTPPVMSMIECLSCGFKNVRKFARGDYVFKSEGICQRCNVPMLITAIYAEEVKKK